MSIDEAYDAVNKIFTQTTGKTPQYLNHGGTYIEDKAL
jgi:hypothetical protein